MWAALLCEANLLDSCTDRIKTERDLMDVRIVALILGKTYPTGTFKTLAEVAYRFFVDVQQVVGAVVMPALPKGWKVVKFTADEEEDGGEPVAAGVTAEGPTKGQIIENLKERGAIVGSSAISRKESGVTFTITKVDKDYVSLHGKKDIKVKVSSFFNEYTVKDVVKKVILMLGL